MKKGALLFILLSSFALFAQQTAIKDPASAPVGTWEPIGPEGIYVKALAASPAYPNEIWAVGTAAPVHVYKTSNGGRSWSLLSTIPTGDRRVDDLAVDPVNPSVIYASEHSGIYKTQDAGLTWNFYPFGSSASAYRGEIAICQGNPDLIYISGSHGYSLHSYGIAVLKSTDGGLSWSTQPAPSSNDYGLDTSLAIDPWNPNILYLGGQEYDGSSWLGHIYKSTDGGGNWTDITGIVQGHYVYALTLDPLNPSRVYAGTDSGVYRSADGGLSWSPNSDPAWAYELVVDPSNSSTIYAGAVDKCYKSVNYGENWTSTGTGLIGYCHSLIFASGGLFCGSDAGIYKSADGGLTWRESHSGIFEPSIWGLAVAPSAPGTVYASRRGAFFKSSDYGNSWSRLADTAGSDIFVNPVNADELLMEVNTPTTTPSGTVESNHISRSVDGGHSWDTIFNGTAFAANPTDFNRVFVLGTNAAGIYGLHKTTDGGNTWTSTGIQFRYAYRVAVDPANDNTVYLSGWYDRGRWDNHILG